MEMLGQDYEIVYTGAEASYKGYYFKKYGITIVFDYQDIDIEKEDNKVFWIDCDDNVEIAGVKKGMNFSQIKEHLGEAPVYEVLYDGPNVIGYQMLYNINNCIVEFFSRDRDGKDSNITLYRNFRRKVGDTVNGETGEIEDYWHVNEITGDLTKISLKSELYTPVVIDKGFIEGTIVSVSENLGNDEKGLWKMKNQD